MTLKRGKCRFLQEEVKFLGHIINAEGIKVDQDKDLQSFVGMCNFYRKFIPHHSEWISQLSHLLDKKSTWNWGTKEKEIFQQIKENFQETVLLNHPDFSKPFYLATDASTQALGAHLYQKSEDGEILNIAFASRKLAGAERNYTITELELLGVVFGCKKFHTYILGYPTIILTDHSALTFLFKCKTMSSRLMRWMIQLTEYRLQIEYIKGSENVIADFLSRYGYENTQRGEPITIHPIVEIPKLKIELKDLQIKQREDETVNWILNEMILMPRETV